LLHGAAKQKNEKIYHHKPVIQVHYAAKTKKQLKQNKKETYNITFLFMVFYFSHTRRRSAPTFFFPNTIIIKKWEIAVILLLFLVFAIQLIICVRKHILYL